MYELPLFPLNTVLFPGMPITLNIFEPRYKLMLQRCLEKDEPFGVVLIHQGLEALGELADPHRVGCTARIASVDRQADGNFNLTAVGDERFKIIELDESRPYLVGKVHSQPLGRDCGLHMQRGRRSLARQVYQYMNMLHQMEGNENQMEAFPTGTVVLLPDDPLTLMYFAAALLQQPVVEKQPLLETNDAGELFNDLLRLYRRETVVLAHLSKSPQRTADRGAWMN
jgi:Lon protease-like protein